MLIFSKSKIIFYINKLALKVVLSAKLAEGKLRIIDTEKLDAPKTKEIATVINKMDKRSRILIVHPYDIDYNFKLAH